MIHMGTVLGVVLESLLLFGMVPGPWADTAVGAAVDVKPRACPNPLNVRNRGILSVAILGTRDFDVRQIDPASILLAGIAPRRSAFEDVATPVEPFTGKEQPEDCTDQGPDGFLDLTLAFDIQEVVEAIEAALGPVEENTVVVLPLEGALFQGTPVAGEDAVVVSKNGSEKVTGLNLTNTFASSTIASHELFPSFEPFPIVEPPFPPIPICPSGSIEVGSKCIPIDLQIPGGGGGGGGGCAINPGGGIDPTLAGGTALMLIYVGWKRFTKGRSMRS